MYTCFWDWHSPVRVKENNKRRREKKAHDCSHSESNTVQQINDVRVWRAGFLLISTMGGPSEALYIIWPGQQKRLNAVSGIRAQVNHSDMVDWQRLYLLICLDTLKNKNKQTNKQTVFTVNFKPAWACFAVLLRFSKTWAISNSPVSCKVPMKTRLNGSLQLPIFFLTKGNPCSQRETQHSLQREIAHAYTANMAKSPSCLWTVRCVKSKLD